MGPTSHAESRTARVTSPAATFAAASAMPEALTSTSASGSYAISAANPSGMPRVGTTLTDLPVVESTCSATAMMFLLLGRMTTESAGTASTASRIWAVDGFMDWPPVTTRWTPSEWKIREIPSPVAMATTAVVAGSGSGAGLSPASRTQRSSSTSSSRSVTRMREGLPMSIAASMAAPMLSV